MQSILFSDEKDGTNAGRNDLHISLQRLRQLPVVWRRAVQGPQAVRSDEGEGSAAQPDQLQGDGQGVWGVRRPEDGVSRDGRAVRELPARRGELQLPADGLHQRQKRWIQTRNAGHCCLLFVVCCCYLLSCYSHLRFKHTVLGTHLSCLGCVLPDSAMQLRYLLLLFIFYCFYYIHLRFKHTVLGTHLSCLGCVLPDSDMQLRYLLFFILIFMLISTCGSSMLAWAHTSVVWAVCCQIQTCN